MQNKPIQHPKVLVLTSTFPRWENDPEPAFVFELRRRLCSQSYMKVLSPETPRCKKHESMGRFSVIM